MNSEKEVFSCLSPFCCGLSWDKKTAIALRLEFVSSASFQVQQEERMGAASDGKSGCKAQKSSSSSVSS